jgi:NADH:ubiquinone oxidoreductase subunit F (NADH-binding)
MKTLSIMLLLFIGLNSCKKCGPCYESLNGVIQPTLTREICSNKEEDDKREQVIDYNDRNGTRWIVICDR